MHIKTLTQVQRGHSALNQDFCLVFKSIFEKKNSFIAYRCRDGWNRIPVVMSACTN